VSAVGVGGALAFLTAGGLGRAPSPAVAIPLPSGVSDALLVAGGARAALGSVTFERTRGVPERVVTAVDTASAQVLWKRSLPAASCCAFPVFSATADGRRVAVGGARTVDVFSEEGVPRASVEVAEAGSLVGAVRLWPDGRRLLAGQLEGPVSAAQMDPVRVLWRARVGRAVLDVALRPEGGEAAAVTPDGVVVLGAEDGLVRYRGRATSSESWRACPRAPVTASRRP